MSLDVFFLIFSCSFYFPDNVASEKGISESLEILKNSEQPSLETILEHWLITSPFRTAEFQKKRDQKFSRIQSDWPALKNPAIFQLMEIDFKTLAISENIPTTEAWAVLFSKVKSIVGNNKRDTADVTDWKNLLDLEETTSSKFQDFLPARVQN